MFFCCGIFRVFKNFDDDNIHIEYRPYLYRKKLEEEDEDNKQRAASIIQEHFKQFKKIRDRAVLLYALENMENSVKKM